ncbi:MAG: sodium-dependent transporter [Candidatus Endonucleobacter bathymodioli]|uniref:Sodium-dependent transporter n=1 Tax=Candidatus Endonucleibacter bathymodioli TaxID=539814 RepID=A0AA90NSQ4_9GAMM|nr:sodium-dependent transporter [Candidatus Endonucleobacter bathymodioli]
MSTTSPSNSPHIITESRSQFSSRLGFIISAAGCAVGVGNIWSFPVQTAENGGAVFVLVYLILSFILAYPALVAELTIGRYAQSNPITALQQLNDQPLWQRLGQLTGIVSILTITVIYSFYSIIGGWFIGFFFSPVLSALGLDSLSSLLTDFSSVPTIALTLVFMILTTLIVTQGVQKGIELWSNRLMPCLIILLLILIGFALTRTGGMEGLKVYLLPDFSRIFDTKLLISALGQSFFSMSLGVGAMMVYGSYLSKSVNIPTTAAHVTILDSTVAFLAGLLVIPCMYAATYQGVEIFTPEGTLYNSDKLVFVVLPALFQQLGSAGQLVSTAFFLLLTSAALTSSIAMLETPSSVMVEKTGLRRPQACWLITLIAGTLSTVIILNIETMLSLAVQLATQYMMPVLSLITTIYCAWLIRQDKLLAEIRQGYPGLESSLFWKIWPWYVRTVCPVLILVLVINSF